MSSLRKLLGVLAGMACVLVGQPALVAAQAADSAAEDKAVRRKAQHPRQARVAASKKHARVVTAAESGKTAKKVAAPKPVAEKPVENADGAHASAPPPAAAADDAVRTEGDTEIKSLEFTGLDIEGREKSPQMLYFLKRVRGEFDRPRLPHRSFLPELERSKEEREF